MHNSPSQPTLVFDGECSFCRVWIEYWRKLTGDRVRYTSYQEISQEIGGRFPDSPRKDFASAVTLFLPSGEVRSTIIRGEVSEAVSRS